MICIGDLVGGEWVAGESDLAHDCCHRGGVVHHPVVGQGICDAATYLNVHERCSPVLHTWEFLTSAAGMAAWPLGGKGGLFHPLGMGGVVTAFAECPYHRGGRSRKTVAAHQVQHTLWSRTVRHWTLAMNSAFSAFFTRKASRRCFAKAFQ